MESTTAAAATIQIKELLKLEKEYVAILKKNSCHHFREVMKSWGMTWNISIIA
jgi:hypothetical protein